MITKKGSKHLVDVFLSADGLKDKAVVLVYFLKAPLKFLGHHDYQMIKPIKVKTQAGSFWSNRDIFSAIHLTQGYESAVRKKLELKEGAFIDIGANVGGLSLPVAAKNPKNRVVLVEPEPSNVAVIKKSLEETSLKNVSLIEKGCFSKRGKLKLFKDGLGGSGRHSLLGTGDFWEIEVDTVDHMAFELGLKKVDLIKIDVEGVELQVLKGAKATIRRHRPRVVFEALNQEKLNGIGTFLKDKRYRIEQIDERNYVAEPL